MPLILTEEQELLRDSVREFVRDHSPVAELRRLRDERDETGFSRPLWKQMAELGWAGIPFPEEVGGADLGYAELGVVLEELGRMLVATPFLSTVVLGGGVVLRAGSESQRKDLLPGICSGDLILALAAEETPRFDPYRVATRAEEVPDGYRLQGRKTFVLEGHVADSLIVLARTSGAPGDREGLTLLRVDPGAPGVTVTRQVMVDSRNASTVELEGVHVDASDRLGEVGRAADVLDRVYDRATAALSAEMLGGIQEAFDRTLAYLRERKQFGVPIGSFQALKHRAAQWFCEVELTRSVVMDALRAIDEDRADVPALVSACKARASDTFILSGEEGVQMFGGIGMTDEEEIGFFLKRARAAELTLGDSVYHRDRWARLEGY
ncbi:MAG: acyl-CoA dehydrogenase family protein [Myxococcota bacterium]